jgi:hypothetical protein
MIKIWYPTFLVVWIKNLTLLLHYNFTYRDKNFTIKDFNVESLSHETLLDS